VEVGKLDVIMTTQKDFKNEESMATHSGKAKGGKKGGQFKPSPSFSTK
jgi:hypothetical protein